MSTRYRIIMYERSTDREGGIIDVQPALVPQALAIVAMPDPTEPGETELTDEQARALGYLMGFRSNPSRYAYHFETLAPTQIRRRA